MVVLLDHAVRRRPAAFWNAHTACWVVSPNEPSTVGNQ